MWIVQLALRRPYTFIIVAVLIVMLGVFAILRTSTDIFPDIKIPVIAVVWQYTGLPPDQMAGRITSPFERVLTTTVNDVEHIEASYEAGVLRLSIPVAERAKPRRITIKAPASDRQSISV